MVRYRPKKSKNNKIERHNFWKESFAVINKSYIIFGLILLAYFSFWFNVQMNFNKNTTKDNQLKNLNPDAKLYYSLGQNLINGTGYHDTCRNTEDIAPVGHPALLAFFCIILGCSPVTFSYLLILLSAIFLALAIRLFSASNIISTIAVIFYGQFVGQTLWLAANVESSIIFVNSLLILALTIFCMGYLGYVGIVITGVVLAFHILVRPMFLMPTHLAFVLAGTLALILYIKKSKLCFFWLKRWLIMLGIAETIILSVLLLSYYKYDDARLLMGTYGAKPLYTGNNKYIPPNSGFKGSRYPYPKQFFDMVEMSERNPDISWKQRHEVLMAEVLNYWKTYPGRALHGWWWRFRQFVGIGEGSLRRNGKVAYFHIASMIILALLVLLRAIKIRSDVLIGKMQKSYLGVLILFVFLAYSAIHAVFVYVDFRYVSTTIPLLVAADSVLMYEFIKAYFIKKPKKVDS